jgi:hypothetical protein
MPALSSRFIGPSPVCSGHFVRSASTRGLTIPPTLLALADEVIEYRCGFAAPSPVESVHPLWTTFIRHIRAHRWSGLQAYTRCVSQRIKMTADDGQRLFNDREAPLKSSQAYPDFDLISYGAIDRAECSLLGYHNEIPQLLSKQRRLSMLGSPRKN